MFWKAERWLPHPVPPQELQEQVGHLLSVVLMNGMASLHACSGSLDYAPQQQTLLVLPWRTHAWLGMQWCVCVRNLMRVTHIAQMFRVGHASIRQP